MRHLLILVFFVAPLAAQPVVAPTPDPIGQNRGDNTGDYNVVNSFETGYRFVSVNGNEEQYRSNVNFGNGIRLFSGQLMVHSRDGHGKLFDDLTIQTQDLGNDPYQFASLRIEKNRWYRYDFTWRSNTYFNPALTVSFGEHFLDTQRRLQDHDFTLFPQRKYKLFVGYTRNIQDGPALSTFNFFNTPGDEFALFQNIHRLRNEYRLGGEVDVAGFKLYVMHGWDRFEEDSPLSLSSPSQGNNPSDLTTANSFQRTEPYKGDSPYWRANLYTEKNRWVAANGQFTYVMGRRNFLLDESAAGLDPFGLAQNRQVTVTGNGSRPITTANLTLSLFPTKKFIITNHTGFNHTRMEGNAVYDELNIRTQQLSYAAFQFLGIQMFANNTDVLYHAKKWLGLYAGYGYSTREVKSIEQTVSSGVVFLTPAQQTNHIHSGLTGIRLQLLPPLTINLETEIGRADRPFYPVSERNYHALGARVQYKTKSLLLSAAAHSNYNNNSVSLSAYSSRSRTYSFDASWTPRPWFSLDAGYSKIHFDSLSGIAYFVNSALITGDQSFYVSNLHTANLGARFAWQDRLEFYLGYSHVQDVGDGRGDPFGGSASIYAPDAPPVFLAAQTFPLTYQSPQARISYHLRKQIRWNFGYQFYRYSEQFTTLPNYRAHTGYTSVSWSF